MTVGSESLLAEIGLSREEALILPPLLRGKVTSFLLSWGAWAEAKPLIEADARNTPRGLRSRAALAKACARAGDIAQAEEICAELAGECGGQPMTLAAQGDLLVAKGDYAAAVECYRKMLVCNPNNPDAWSHIARACQTAERWKAAEEYCRRALAEHLRRRGSPRGFSSHDQERKHIPTHLLRLLHRQAVGAGRPGEAEAIAKELSQRKDEAVERTKRMLASYFRAKGKPIERTVSPPAKSAPTPPDELAKHLESLFGYSSFRPRQREAIEAALNGESVIVVMPTGAGKSLCFQLPAMLQDGLTLVVSPLIALMKDQVEGLPEAVQRHTTLVNSSLEPDEIGRRLEAIREGKFRLVYAAPERLRQRPFVHALARRGISLFVIDEVHCLSLWGHDFRPDYLFLRAALVELGKPTIMAATATATPDIQAEVAQHLGRQMRLISTGTFRPNLRLECVKLGKSEEKTRALVELCRKIEGSGIVYVPSREKTELLAAILRRHGVQSHHYHAGMETEQRTASQERFMSGEYRVMVATVAFGMGVDKPDIRFIIHYSPPASIENYYQEVGRAGRDGLPSRCVMLYTPGDKANLSRWLGEDRVRFENLRDCYYLIRDQVGLGKSGPVNVDDLVRELGFEETKVRVAVSLLEKAGLLRRHFDLPQTMSLEVVGRAKPDDLEFADFTSTARLRPAQRLPLNAMELVERTGIPPQDIEAKLLTWQDRGWIWYHASGRAMLLEIPNPRGKERQTLERMLDYYDEAQKSRIDKLFDFAGSKKCRHGMIAAHFGETPVRNCGACDNCSPRKVVESVQSAQPRTVAAPESDIAQVILQVVAAMPFQVGRSGLLKVLKGSIESPLNESRFRLFGVLSNHNKSAIEKEIDDLIAKGSLARDPEPYYLLSLTEAGRNRIEMQS